jgi:hypothetical protein
MILTARPTRDLFFAWTSLQQYPESARWSDTAARFDIVDYTNWVRWVHPHAVAELVPHVTDTPEAPGAAGSSADVTGLSEDAPGGAAAVLRQFVEDVLEGRVQPWLDPEEEEAAWWGWG